MKEVAIYMIIISLLSINYETTGPASPKSAEFFANLHFFYQQKRIKDPKIALKN